MLQRQGKVTTSQSWSNLHNTSRNKTKQDQLDCQNNNNIENEKIKPTTPKKFVSTVPQPFEMTIREDKKRQEKFQMYEIARSVDQKDLEDSKLNKHNKHQHFKAIAMPKHVHEKRYEKLLKQQEQRRNKAKEEALKEIQNIFKPFSFIEREELKSKLRRSDSVPNLKCQERNNFEAHPFPEHLFTDFAYEQQKEKENYREIQKKLRQEILLKSSKYPPRMSADFLKKKMVENKSSSNKQGRSFPKKAKRDKTNLDRLYREYKENLERRKLDQEMSVAIEKATLHERYSKRHNKRPHSADSARSRMKQFNEDHDPLQGYNLTAKLRLKILEDDQEKRAKLKYYSEREAQVREDRERRRRVNNPVWDNIKTDANHNNIRELTEKRKYAESMRMKNYKLELEEMMRRVENQPTLFQKQSQVSSFQLRKQLYKS